MPQRSPLPLPRPGPSGPPERFGSCSRVLFARPESGPGEVVVPGIVEEIPYRRCPVGLIAAVDCPEFAGLVCRHHDPRGERAKSVVPRSEVPMLAAELADDGYLTETYRRRLRGLRVEVAPRRTLPPVEGAVSESDGGPAARSSDPGTVAPRAIVAPPTRRTSPRPEHAPVNVPSDEARRLATAARRAAERAKGPGSA